MATDAGKGKAGILVTWRESPPASKALLAGIFVNRLGAFVGIFLVLFLTTRGFTAVQAGAALATFTVGGTLGAIVGGTLTDWIGARRTIVISMAGGGVLTLAILYADDYAALLVVVFLVGLVGGWFRPADAALLSALTPKQRQVMIFAMSRLAYNLGSTAAPLIGAALIAVSYDLLFWGEAAAMFAYAAVAAIALPRREPKPADAGEGEPGAAASRRGYLAVLADHRFMLFLAAALINAIVYVQYLSTLPVAMRDAGYGATAFSVVIALNGFIVITCELLVTKVTQNWPMRIVVLVGFALLGAGMATYALPFGLAVFVIGTLIWTLAEIIAGPTIFAYPAIAAPDRLRGRYIGALTTVFGVGSATGSIVGLAVYSELGRGVWLLCGLACVAGMAVAWYGMRVAVKPAAEPPAKPADPTDDAERIDQT